MRLLRTMRIHDAVLWRQVSRKPDGKWVYAAPEPIKVRWDDRQEEYMTADGKRVSRACVFMGELPIIGCVLWKGKKKNLVDTANPFANPEAWAIQGRIAVDTIKGRDTLWMAYL